MLKLNHTYITAKRKQNYYIKVIIQLSKLRKNFHKSPIFANLR